MTLTPTTRASLLLRLRDPRDHDAWVEFVSLYEPVIYRVARRTGLQDADALEVLQELFLAVNRKIGCWEHGAEYGSFRGWLRRVTIPEMNRIPPHAPSIRFFCLRPKTVPARPQGRPHLVGPFSALRGKSLVRRATRTPPMRRDLWDREAVAANSRGLSG